MKEKILKFVVIINIILIIIYVFDIVLRIIGLSRILYQNLLNFPILYNSFYFFLAFIGWELMLVSIIIFTLKPKLSKNLKILLLINLFIIILSFVFLFIKE